MRGDEICLRLDDVSKRFGGVQAVSSLSFTVAEGSFTGLIGPNGAGKTTTLNIVCRYIQPDDGAVTFEGESLLKLKPHGVARQGIARTFQTPQIFDDLSVLENVMVGVSGWLSRRELVSATLGTPVSRRTEGEIRLEASRWLRRVGLEEDTAQRAGSLPFGRLRLLEVARAAASRPRLLLMDEPSSGLSPMETAELRRVLDGLRQDGATILLVEHNMRLVMAATTYIVVLDQGAKLAEGTPSEVRANHDVQVAYLGRYAEADADDA